MKKLYICVPTVGIPASQVMARQVEVINKVVSHASEPVEFMPAYIPEQPKSALECLGHSLIAMSKADMAIFARGWEDAKECVIMQECVKKYSVPMMLESEFDVGEVQ